MALNTYPYSPFPASTEQLHKGDNEDLQAQIDAIKDGTDIDSFGDVETALGVVTGDITELETDKADLEVVAPAFDAEAGTYDVGDQVTYDGKLYEFTSAHSTAGAWDPTEVTEKTVADEIGTVKSGLTNVTKNDGGASVDISAYTSSNPYTATHDGYVVVSSERSTSGVIQVFTKGANNNLSLGSIGMNVTGLYQIESMYVRKGMRVYVNSNTASGSTVSFIPII